MDIRRAAMGGKWACWLWPAAILASAALGAVAAGWAHWPGILIADSRWQYQQALSGYYEDWHPPVMAWIWRQLHAIASGPAPMLTLQLMLYWLGLALAGMWAWRRHGPIVGLALVGAGWVPVSLTLMGMVSKDALMAGCLASACGLLLYRQLVRSRAAVWALTGGALLALGLAAALRFNAVLACLPLAVIALPVAWRASKARLAATVLGAAAVLLALAPVINAATKARPMHPELSLIIFDLGGITAHSGVNNFPAMGVADPVAANRRCYDAMRWDDYASWANEPCPLGYDRFLQQVEAQGLQPAWLWLSAIARHPVAYAKHRLAHFNIATWFMVETGPGRRWQTDSLPNIWGYQVQANPLLGRLNYVLIQFNRTPLGWPIFWIFAALAVLIVTLRSTAPPMTRAIAASAFLYGLGYLVCGVATDMRYHGWTITGSVVACVLLAGDLLRRDLVPSARLACLAGAVIAVPTSLAIAARILW